MAIVSIGDIVVCTQLAYRLYICLTNGREKAPRDMKELEEVLFGLYSALRYLEREFENILSQSSDQAQRDVEEKKEQLGRMINSCLRVLTELDEATATYRPGADDSTHTAIGPYYRVLGVGYSQQLKTQAKMQWRRVLWYLRSDSFAKYRLELQSHTSAINLFVNIMILSALHGFPFQQRLTWAYQTDLGPTLLACTTLEDTMHRCWKRLNRGLPS